MADNVTNGITGDSNIRSIFGGLRGDAANKILPFKTNERGYSFRFGPDSDGVLSICPKSMRYELSKSGENPGDISIAKAVNGGFERILQLVPAVQIREYAQDSRIMQIYNIAKMFIQGLNDAPQIAWEVLKGEIASIQEAFVNAADKFSAWPGGVDKHINGNLGIIGNKDKKAVLDVPFVLYYEMMTSRTTGYYTLPYSGKLVDASNGSVGWNTQRGFAGLQTSEYSVLGKVLNILGKNLKFNATPVWDGNTQNDYPQMQVEVDLFNDNLNSALQNFLFINQIIPKNRFLQYHIFQHNSCVYDVKIEGYGRFYMCSGNIECNYKGVSRKPGQEFFSRLKGYVSDAFKGYLGEGNVLDELNMVRIPDVYNVKLTLTSLLPNSLNNYLFRYSGNGNIMTGDGVLSSNNFSNFGDESRVNDIASALSSSIKQG